MMKFSGTIDVINPLFVAERVCVGVDQLTACESKYVEGCKHWPNPNIKLPNVTHTMQEIIDKIDYLSCIPEKKFVSSVANFDISYLYKLSILLIVAVYN